MYTVICIFFYRGLADNQHTKNGQSFGASGHHDLTGIITYYTLCIIMYTVICIFFYRGLADNQHKNGPGFWDSGHIDLMWEGHSAPDRFKSPTAQLQRPFERRV